MNNAEKYKRIYAAVSATGGLPTIDQLNEIVEIVYLDFPMDHGGGNFPTVTVKNNGSITSSLTKENY